MWSFVEQIQMAFLTGDEEIFFSYFLKCAVFDRNLFKKEHPMLTFLILYGF
jgi:hypothetical protein